MHKICKYYKILKYFEILKYFKILRCIDYTKALQPHRDLVALGADVHHGAVDLDQGGRGGACHLVRVSVRVLPDEEEKDL